ncbi:MAG: diacylglycerol kinase family protein [Lacisediminihabitans sp.]
MTELTTKTAAVVYNPTKVDLPALRQAVQAEALATGWSETLWCETSVEDVGQKVTKDALDKGVDLVIAAGGDGTVRAVAEALRGTEVPIALVPSGTGNLLARNLKLTLDDMPGSVLSAFTGIDRKVDLCVIDIEREDKSRDRHVFLVMAGMGIDAKMIKNTDDDLKSKAGWAAYVQAITKSLSDPDELHLHLQLDKRRAERITMHTLMVGNCGSLPGKILLMPDAVVDDGVFDVMMMRPGGPLGWIRIWAKVALVNSAIRGTALGRARAGEPKKDQDIRYDTGKQVTARLSRPEEIELDGDGFGKATAFKVWIEPGALSVRISSASQ